MSNEITIISVGDLFLGEHPFTLGHGVSTIAKQKGSDFFFDRIKQHLQNGDIVCGNLEGIISPKENNENTFLQAIFWGESDSAPALKNAGFNCLFLANNHTAQHGKNALIKTCKLLDKHGIKWTGFNPESAEITRHVEFSIRGKRVALLAYCDTQQYNLDNPLLPLISPERIKSDIDSLKDCFDNIIVSLHWGDEFITYPSQQQIKLAHEIIDAGAHLILGHHSHTLQGIEKYKHGLIVYSQGSFIKDLWRPELKESIILRTVLNKSGLVKYESIPIYINDKYQPEPIIPPRKEHLLKKLQDLSNMIDKTTNLPESDAQLKYSIEVARLEKMDKLDNLKHYIKNIYRYDTKMLFSNILLIIKRRIYGKNI